MFRGGFAWPNAVQNMSGERQWKRKKIESIPEYWSEMTRRSPGKKESLYSLTTREINLTRSYRNLSALIKWEIPPVYWNRSFEQFREFKIQRRGRQLELQKNDRFNYQNNNFARATHFFCSFLSRFCTTTTWKCLISRFMEDVNKQRRNFISLSKLECGPLKFSFRRVRLQLTK